MLGHKNFCASFDQRRCPFDAQAGTRAQPSSPPKAGPAMSPDDPDELRARYAERGEMPFSLT
jgi:hypothetical protein